MGACGPAGGVPELELPAMGGFEASTCIAALSESTCISTSIVPRNCPGTHEPVVAVLFFHLPCVFGAATCFAIAIKPGVSGFFSPVGIFELTPDIAVQRVCDVRAK